MASRPHRVPRHSEAIIPQDISTVRLILQAIALGAPVWTLPTKEGPRSAPEAIYCLRRLLGRYHDLISIIPAFFLGIIVLTTETRLSERYRLNRQYSCVRFEAIP